MNHTIFITQCGRVYSCGQGKLDDCLDQTVIRTPQLVKSLAKFHIVQIDHGEDFYIAMTRHSEVLTWGNFEL